MRVGGVAGESRLNMYGLGGGLPIGVNVVLLGAIYLTLTTLGFFGLLRRVRGLRVSAKPGDFTQQVDS